MNGRGVADGDAPLHPLRPTYAIFLWDFLFLIWPHKIPKVKLKFDNLSHFRIFTIKYSQNSPHSEILSSQAYRTIAREKPPALKF